MSAEPLVLALDAGSQSVRALLFDPRGKVAALGRAGVPPPLPPAAPGAVEFAPEDHLRALVAATRACLDAAGPGAKDRIVGAGLTTQRRCFVAADADGRPIRPAIHWLDRRRAKPDVPWGAARAVLRLLGDESLVPTLLGISQGNLLRECDRPSWDKARWLLTLSGWLTMRLTGEVADAAGSIAGVWPFDAKTGKWMGASWLAELLGCPLDRLPALRPAGQELGRLRADVAAEMGLPDGLPLYAVGGDKQAELLGSGATPDSPGVAAVSLGTGSSLLVPSEKPRASLRFKWLTNPAAQPGVWALEYMVFRGFWTVSWFLKELGAEERAEAEREGITPEEAMGRAWEGLPPGAHGLLALPRWAPAPEHLEERGAFLGFTEDHGRAHMARAVVEGIAFDLYRGAGILRGATGTPIRELRATGGGSRSGEVVRILADLFDAPVALPDQPEISARGAAVVAAVAAGLHPDPGAAAKAMCAPARKVEPDRGRGARYREIYEGAWLPALRALRPASKGIGEVFAER